MLILPLKFIREEDKKTIGLNLYNLAKLGHLGLPVVESVIVVAPIALFEKALHIFLRPHVNIKDHLKNLKAEILKISLPESLTTFNSLNYSKEKTKLIFDTKKLWENLLEKWSGEIISRIERDEKKILELTPQLIIFSANFTVFGKAFFDEDRGHAVIKTEKGKLNFQASQAIENMIIVGNKKLVFPQIYHWGIEDGKIKIVKVTPFTQSLPDEKPVDSGEAVSAKPASQSRSVKTATKVLLDYKGEIINDFNEDGALLEIKKVDTESVNAMLRKILNFAPNAKIIFSPDFELNTASVLEYAKLFLFFKNKQKLECQIILPETFSKDEYLQLKRDYASLGLYSKGSLKLWKQFNTIADFLNLDDYLDAGFDGAVLDIDKISKLITGVDPEVIAREMKIDWVVAIEKFFKVMSLSKIIKNLKPVLIRGRLSQNEELLNYFIKTGIWGLALESQAANSLKEHISFLEKQTVRKLNDIKIQH